ncbi:choice-of-anchor D domain-containing protein [bacterium]|nr:choice-of-anchor D domain-containing protein [bacterium]
MFIIIGQDTLEAQSFSLNFGGTQNDASTGCIITPDDCFILAGYSASYSLGGDDVWLLKINKLGSIVWEMSLGDSSDDYIETICLNSDGGFTCAGKTSSFGAVGSDIWVIRFDSTGSVLWQYRYPTSTDDSAYSIQQTLDGGFILTGDSVDFLVMKLNSDGTVNWSRTYGEQSQGRSVRQTVDGGYIVAGSYYLTSTSRYSVWVIKLDQSGDIVWQKMYGADSMNEFGKAIRQTTDGGFIVTGSYIPLLTDEGWILKLDNQGSIQWQNRYYNADSNVLTDSIDDIEQTADGGYIFTGSCLGLIESGKTWAQKIFADGSLDWNRDYSAVSSRSTGDAIDALHSLRGELVSVRQMSDGSFIFGGTVDNSESHPGLKYDLRAIKTRYDGSINDESECPGYSGLNIGLDPTTISGVDTSVSPVVLSLGPISTTAVPVTSSAQISGDCTDYNVFDLSCNPDVFFADRGGKVYSECTLTTGPWWSAEVDLSCQGLIFGDDICSFGPSHVSLDLSDNQTSQLSLSLSHNHNAGDIFQFQVVGTDGVIVENDEISVQITALDPEPNPIWFADCPSGEIIHQTIQVTNISGSSVTITGITSPAAPFSISYNNCSGQIQPGGSCYLEISFSPIDVGVYSDTFTITSVGGEVNTIFLFGQGTSPELQVRLLSPNGGESWAYSPSAASRKNHLLAWESSYFLEIERTSLYYSTDEGENWTCLADSALDNYHSTDGPIEIPDGNSSGSESLITISDVLNIANVNIKIELDHPCVSDLEISLIGPDTTSVILCDQVGTSGANFNGTIFDQEADQYIDEGSAPYTGFFKPDQSLMAFNGLNTDGLWRLHVVDNIATETGTLLSWTINFSDCSNENISGDNRLGVNDTTFCWELPTETEASLAGQTFPSATCRIKVQVEGEGSTLESDQSDHNFYIIQESTTSVKTLIAWNSERMCAAYETNPLCNCTDWVNNSDCPVANMLWSKLLELSDHAKIMGAIIDLADVSSLTPYYQNWDLDPTNQVLANELAENIRDYLQNLVNTVYTEVNAVILIGDDIQVPFFRLRDGTSVYPESNYTNFEALVDETSTIGSALDQDYFLTDNYYVEFEPEASGIANPEHSLVYLPDMMVGRLVENPEQITAVINAFLAQDGQANIEPDPAQNLVLVTGSSFLYDSAFAITQQFDQFGYTTGFDLDCLLDDPESELTEVCIDAPYTPAQLEAEMFSVPAHALMNINTHANHFSFAASIPASVYDILYCTDQTYDSQLCYGSDMYQNPQILTGSVLFSSGCHSGLVVPPTDAFFLDLPEQMALKSVVAYIGNTGYGWGLKYGRGLSEKLMELVSAELVQNNSLSIGAALTQAKRKYFQQERRYDVFDEKVLHQLTLFGIPHYLIVSALPAKKNSEADGYDQATPDDHNQLNISIEKSIQSGSNSSLLPPGLTELDLHFTFGSGTYQLITTPDGDYYELNGQSSGEVGQTIQPHFVYDSNLSGTVAHGVIFRGGTYTLNSSFNPVIAVPRSTNPDLGEGPLPLVSGFTPCIRVSYGSSGGSSQKATNKTGQTTMVVHTGYFVEANALEHHFDDMQLTIYYSNEEDESYPIITDPGPNGFHQVEGLNVQFSVSVTDPEGIFRVLVSYNEEIDQTWETLDLVYQTSTDLWTASLELIGSILYYVQAVDINGNVGCILLNGDDLDGLGQPYGSTWSEPKTFTITVADSDGDNLPDIYEALHPCLNIGIPDSELDPDYDSLINYDEFRNKTDPCLADTDGGFDNDGSEYYNGRDPLSEGDDLEITIVLSKETSLGDLSIHWEPELGQNDLILGQYYVYRSANPFFAGLELLAGPLENTETSLSDSPGSGLYYYQVWNTPLPIFPAPFLFGINPTYGPVTGGTTVELYGKDFQEGSSIYFCDSKATAVQFINASLVSCQTPTHSAGSCDVILINPDEQSAVLSDGFVYQ